MVISLSIASVILSSCSIIKDKDISSENSHSLGSKMELIYLSKTKYDEQIITALQKNGFFILESNSENKQNIKFGLTINLSNEIDWCQGRKARKLDNVTYKVIKMSNNNPEIIIEDSGWTGSCGLYKKSVFEKLSAKLNKKWQSPNGSWLSW